MRISWLYDEGPGVLRREGGRVVEPLLIRLVRLVDVVDDDRAAALLEQLHNKMTSFQLWVHGNICCDSAVAQERLLVVQKRASRVCKKKKKK